MVKILSSLDPATLSTSTALYYLNCLTKVRVKSRTEVVHCFVDSTLDKIAKCEISVSSSTRLKALETRQLLRIEDYEVFESVPQMPMPESFATLTNFGVVDKEALVAKINSIAQIESNEARESLLDLDLGIKSKDNRTLYTADDLNLL